MSHLEFLINVLFQQNFGIRSINKILDLSSNFEEFSENTKIAFENSRLQFVENALNVKTVLDNCKLNRVELVTYFDKEYPKLLRQIPDAPLILACKGNLNLLENQSISIVGTRNCSAYGQRVTKELCEFLSYRNVITVSGMAFGIDAVVHQNSTQTIAVLPTFPSKAIPANNFKIYNSIIENNGLVVSENIKDEPIASYMYVSRNRIVAGLSSKTVIIEAAEKSGAIITAEYALDYNREVYAVPGNIFSESSKGCHKLIRSDVARILTSYEDLIENDNLVPIIPFPKAQNLTEDETCIYYALSDKGLSIDELSIQTAISLNVLGYTLINLELKGLIQKDILNNYSRIK